MNLMSCGNCGVVYDKDWLFFPSSLYKEDGTIDDELAVWDGDTFVPCVQCRVCGEKMTEDQA